MEPVAWQHLVENLIAAAVFSALGILLFLLGFYIFEKITPGTFWKEILQDQNTALAVLMAGIAIAFAIIIAAAVT